MTNVTAGAYADIPLFLFHLLEYLDLDYEIDVDDINRRWAQASSVDVWSQLVLKETADGVERLTRAPKTGIWRMDDDGGIAFARWGNDWHSLHDETEAFFLRVLGAGRLPLPGRRPRHAGRALADADRGQPADGSRSASGSTAIHGEFAGEPLPVAEADRFGAARWRSRPRSHSWRSTPVAGRPRRAARQRRGDERAADQRDGAGSEQQRQRR